MIVKDAGAWSSSKMVRYPHIGLELGNFFFTQILHFRAKMVVTSELTTFPYMVKQSCLENRFLFREKIVTIERRQFFCLIWSTSRVSKKTGLLLHRVGVSIQGVWKRSILTNAIPSDKLEAVNRFHILSLYAKVLFKDDLNLLSDWTVGQKNLHYSASVV